MATRYPVELSISFAGGTGVTRSVSREEVVFATADGGFWVARIEGQVREYLGLDAKNVSHGLPALNVPLSDRGAPGTVRAARLADLLF